MPKSFKLPPIEKIEEMERQRTQAIESLEVSDGFVKCQKCGIAVPMLRITKEKSHRITVLENQVRWLQEHHDYIHRLRVGGNNNNNNNDGNGNNNNNKENSVLKQQNHKPRNK